MRAKIKGILIGSVHREFERDGSKIEYRQVSVNIPGELEANVIKVPKEMDDFDGLRLYTPVYMIVDLRCDSRFKTYEARAVKVCKDERELNDTDPYFDNAEANSYLSSLGAEQRASSGSKH